MGSKDIEDVKEKILVLMPTKINPLLVLHNMMPPRRTILRKIKANTGIANVQREKEGTGGNPIVKTRKLQIVGVQAHTIWIAPIVVYAVLMDV